MRYRDVKNAANSRYVCDTKSPSLSRSDLYLQTYIPVIFRSSGDLRGLFRFCVFLLN